MTPNMFKNLRVASLVKLDEDTVRVQEDVIIGWTDEKLPLPVTARFGTAATGAVVDKDTESWWLIGAGETAGRGRPALVEILRAEANKPGGKQK